MDRCDYPADVRTDYPQRSSRGWAALTILWIKFLALIPHAFVLVFLGIAEFVVAFVAQFVVAFKGEYPAGMHQFVTGVLRWRTRVAAFVLSVTDRYPPFSLQPIDDYPVDVVVERPAQPSRVYAAFTIVVQILVIVAGIAFAAWLINHADTIAAWSSGDGEVTSRYTYQSWPGTGLALRQLAAIPHWIVLAFLGIAVAVLWFVVQWVILFVARFPQGMWDIVAGYVRWYARVNAYALGLIDRYPPFTMRPSCGVPASGTPSWPSAPPTPPTPPAPAVPGTQTPPATAQPVPPPPPDTPWQT
jgi:Domain of unknown function (DUF4389)